MSLRAFGTLGLLFSLALPGLCQTTTAPVIRGLWPTFTVMGGGDFSFAVDGDGFSDGSTVMWNTTALASTEEDSFEIYAAVPASLLVQAGTVSITVVTNGVASNSVPFVVLSLSVNPISPNVLDAGGPDSTLTITGGGFTTGTTVTWGSTPLVVTAVTDNQITATLPAALTAVAGAYTVTVAKPDGSSATASVVVVPAITSVTPASPPPANADLTITVTGAGFSSTSGVLEYEGETTNENLAITSVTPTKLTAVIPAAVVAGFTWQGLLVYEDVPPGSSQPDVASNQIPYPVTGTPYIYSINPYEATAGGPGFTLGIWGSYFTNNMVVLWNGTPLQTTGSGWGLSATVPASLIATPGTAVVSIGGPGGPYATKETFTINAPPLPPPTITYLSPASVPAGNAAFTLSIYGANFQPGASVISGKPLPTTFISSTELTVPMAANLPAGAGVQVLNPDGQGAEMSLKVVPPVVFAADPSFALQNGADWPVTLRGRNFTQSSQITWNGTPVPTTFLSPERLQGVVPGSLVGNLYDLASAVTAQVPSNAASVEDLQAQPYIQSADPPAANAGGPDLNLTLSGYGFAAGATLRVYGGANPSIAVPTTWTSVNQLQATIPAASVAQSDTLRLTPINPDGTAMAGPFYYPIYPVLESVNPDYISPGPPGNPFSITGKGFTPGTSLGVQLCVAGTPPQCDSIPTAFAVSSTVVSGTLTANTTVSVPQAWFQIADPVPPLPFHIGTPGLDSLAPASVAAGSGGFTLTVNGAALPQGSVVQWNGANLATTFVSASQLTAVVPSTLTDSPDGASVTVAMPDGSVTLPLIFNASPAVAPSISPDGIVNAFSYGAVSGYSLISIFGSGLAGGTYSASSTPLPTSLHGVTVSVGGTPAPIFFVSPNQINAQIPEPYYGPPQPVVVTFAGVGSAPELADIYGQAPGILFNPATNHVVAQNYPDWTINSPSNPASPGQQVIVYWTGYSPDLPAAGQVSPAGGQQATLLSSYAATFDDQPAQLTFVGPTPGLVGVLQFNVVVPNVAPGEHRLDFWDNWAPPPCREMRR